MGPIPEDQTGVRALYHQAVEDGDAATLGAIERLLVVHAEWIEPADLASLRRERFALEAHELYQAIGIAEYAHDAVESALHAAASIVAERGRGLPNTDDGAEASLADDGLRRILISQFEEATA